MLDREALPAIPDDCVWQFDHNGQRRAQPVRIEVRRAAPEVIEAYRAGRRNTIPLAQVVCWDYSTGSPQDVAEVTARLAKVAANVADLPRGIVA